MLEFLLETDRASERKQRLFAVACCRRVWHLPAHEDTRRAVDAAERYADGEAARGELDRACDRVDVTCPNGGDVDFAYAASCLAFPRKDSYPLRVAAVWSALHAAAAVCPDPPTPPPFRRCW